MKIQHPTSAIVLLVLLILSGCETAPEVRQTSMEMQAYQSQEFDAPKQALFDATLSVLQDAGYIIESADMNSGFITGKAPTKSKMSLMWGAMNQGGKVTATVSAR